jgi:cytochrome c-type biogenesis protein CcmH/NrfG
LKLDPSSGETWGSLGHCHLMMDNLQEAYTSYQQALYHLRDPKVSCHATFYQSRC